MAEAAKNKSAKTDISKTREQWIESAAYLGAERHEVAGALFNSDGELKESEVRKKIEAYRGKEGN